MYVCMDGRRRRSGGVTKRKYFFLGVLFVRNCTSMLRLCSCKGPRGLLEDRFMEL